MQVVYWLAKITFEICGACQSQRNAWQTDSSWPAIHDYSLYFQSGSKIGHLNHCTNILHYSCFDDICSLLIKWLESRHLYFQPDLVIWINWLVHTHHQHSIFGWYIVMNIINVTSVNMREQTSPVITSQLHCFQLRTTLNGMDFKFVSHGLWSEEQNILLQHMHKKEFWPINVELSLNTKTRLRGQALVCENILCRLPDNFVVLTLFSCHASLNFQWVLYAWRNFHPVSEISNCHFHMRSGNQASLFVRTQQDLAYRSVSLSGL